MPNSPETSFDNIAASGSSLEEQIVESPEQNPDQVSRPVFEDEDSVSYLGVRLEKSKVPSSFVPDRSKYTDYISDKFAIELQQKIAISMLQGDPMLIEGGTSLGKTTTIRKMCAELGWEVHYANLNGATDVEDLMGRYIPNPNKTDPNDPEYIFADGKVTSGLRLEEGKKKVIILDEFNASAPNILIRLHEVLDALERDGEVVLSEDASEVVHVSRNDTKVVALMNPPGKGYFGREPLDPAQLRRWTYTKEPTDLPETTFAFSTQAIFGVGGKMEAIPESEYLTTVDTRLSKQQLAEIPGMNEILGKYQEFHKAAKEMVKKRMVGADQPQPFTFDDRMEPARIANFVATFYNGDLSETFQRALRYYYVNKLERGEDRQKLEELINHVSYVPPVDSRRRTIGEEESQTPEAQPETEAYKTRVAKEVDDLLAHPDVPEAVKAALAGKETPLSGEIAEQIEIAREKLGDDFIGPEEIRAAFGDEVEISEIPPIPFSPEALEKAKELGQMLVLRVDKAADGSPLTMLKIHDILNDRLDADGRGEVLRSRDDEWKMKSDFYTKESAANGWALVSKETVPDSTSKNYLQQTETLVNYLQNEVFAGKPLPEEYQSAIDEFEREKASIAELISSDWKKATEKLEALQVNQLTRQTPVEALYDLMVRYQQTDERLLTDIYTWTNRRLSGGALVCVGYFKSDGVGVYGYEPGYADSNLGVSFSRSR